MIEIRGASPLKNENDWMNAWKTLAARPEAGFTRFNAEVDWEAITRRREELKGVKHVAVLGIGGSSLGTQVIAQALQPATSVKLEFLESPDPLAWREAEGRLNARTHYLIVSKSGSTLETLTWVEKLASEGRLKPSQCTVIASPGQGPLHRWAELEKVPVLWIPPAIGGRFSVLTAVGLLPAALLGLKVEEFRAGAEWALSQPKLAATLAVEAIDAWGRGEWITQMWSFSVGLRAFGEWWQQLWAESLAKKVDRQGRPAVRVSSPMACTGPRDQHSVAQQLIEGARDKSVFVTRVTQIEQDHERFMAKLFTGMPFSARETAMGQVLGAEAEAFERALSDTGISYLSLHVPELSERSLGALFMLWQMTVALLGEKIGLNPFDQPGVELGKKHAAKILQG